MTENAVIPTNMDQAAGLMKKFLPPVVGLSIGFGVGDMLGIGALVEGFIMTYIPKADADMASKLGAVASVAAYLGLFFALRKTGMIGRTLAWAGIGVAINMVLALKEEVLG